MLIQVQTYAHEFLKWKQHSLPRIGTEINSFCFSVFPPTPIPFYSSVPHHSHKERQDIQEQRVSVLARARTSKWDHLGLRGQILWEGGKKDQRACVCASNPVMKLLHLACIKDSGAPQFIHLSALMTLGVETVQVLVRRTSWKCEVKLLSCVVYQVHPQTHQNKNRNQCSQAVIPLFFPLPWVQFAYSVLLCCQCSYIYLSASICWFFPVAQLSCTPKLFGKEMGDP